MSSTTQSLTAHLQTQYTSLHTAATQHNFLLTSGRGIIPASLVSSWLVQDKWYQHAYVSFIGRLISKVNLSKSPIPKAGVSSGDEENSENLPFRTLQSLSGALQGILDEITFYNSTAIKYNLNLIPAPENKTSTAYRHLFESASSDAAPLLHGLVVLWATELVYLHAWRFAKSHMQSTEPESIDGGNTTKGKGGNKAEQHEKGAIKALHKEFIPNWTSDTFHGVVDGLAGLVDEWASTTELKAQDLEACCELWRRVLELEVDFWPVSQSPTRDPELPNPDEKTYQRDRRSKDNFGRSKL
jgi:thiaminase